MVIIEQKKVSGFDELNALLSGLMGRVIILFTGSRIDDKSWCPDCVKAEPVVEKVISEVASAGELSEVTFVECAVGLREYWKNPTNPFRSDERFKLTEIPTLMEYGSKFHRFSLHNATADSSRGGQLFGDGEAII